MELKEKVIEIIATQLQIDADNISDSSEIIEDLGADSLDIVEMLMTLEDQYDIVVPDEAIPELKRVSDVIKYLEDNFDI